MPRRKCPLSNASKLFWLISLGRSPLGGYEGAFLRQMRGDRRTPHTLSSLFAKTLKVVHRTLIVSSPTAVQVHKEDSRA